MLVHWNPVLPNGQHASTRHAELFHTLSRSCDVKVPVALHVTRGSRKLALLYLTERFHGYWNFKLDTLYLDVKPYMGHAARFNLAYLVENGLLDGFRNLALGSEIWCSSLEQNSPHWYVILVLLLTVVRSNLNDIQLEICASVQQYYDAVLLSSHG
jgi:hypothetical protein